MPFAIKATLSNKSWAKIDKPALWKRLYSGLAAGEAGAAEAIRELYAVTTKPVDMEITGADVLLPHHEVRENGDVVLNQGGLVEAAAALAADNTLTDGQRERARQHLLRHYRELEIDPPESLLADETRAFEARVSGEMRADEVPLAPGVDLAALKESDDDPLEVVVEVPVGRSTRGWNYREQALRDVVDGVMSGTLPGYLGHQKPEEVNTQFPTPVTHWVGAKFENGKAYFRGVVDRVAADLKRWIRTKRIRQVSIFGMPKLERVNGETHVTGYSPISIDWTPLNRAGMPTRIVAIGEMDSTFPQSTVAGELDGSYEDLREAIHAAASKLFREGWVHVERLYEDFVIILHEPKATGERKLYRFTYRRDGDTVVLSDRQEVEEKREYLPVGEMTKGDGDEMELTEMFAAIRSAIAKGETDLPKVFGEMGVTKEAGVKALVGDEFDKAKQGAEFGAKLAAALGFDKDMHTEAALALAGEMAGVCKSLGLEPGSDVNAVKAQVENLQAVYKALGFDEQTPDKPAEVAGEMAKLYNEQHQTVRGEMIDKLIGEKVAGEQAQALIKRMLHVPDNATEEQIAGEIDALLGDDVVKGLIGGSFIDQPAGTGGGGSQGEQRQHTREKRSTI